MPFLDVTLFTWLRWDFVCMFFIYASFLEFIAVNYLARLKIFQFCPVFLVNVPFPFRWVQDPEQQKKKKENAILDVRIFLILNPSSSNRITMSLKSLRVVTIFHVNSYNSSWSKTIKPNHNVLKVSASGDGCPERALSNGEGRNAQHRGNRGVPAQRGETDL